MINSRNNFRKVLPESTIALIAQAESSLQLPVHPQVLATSPGPFPVKSEHFEGLFTIMI